MKTTRKDPTVRWLDALVAQLRDAPALSLRPSLPKATPAAPVAWVVLSEPRVEATTRLRGLA